MAETPNLNQPNQDPLKELRNAVYGTGVDMADPKPIDFGINDGLVGNFDTGPNPYKRTYNENLGKDILGYMSQTDQWANDPGRFAKVYDYGADWKHANFDRYYNHNSFKELGFSPYRDNDATYNEKGSAWDDFNRAMMGNVRLFGHGFISTEESGESAAEAMERINSVYGSTRGGVGGFMSNLALSAGYTQGILGRIFLEEAALAGVTLLSGGTTSAATIPMMGVELGRGIKNIVSGVRNLGKTYQTFKQLDNIDVARKIFNTVKGIPGAVGRTFIPRTSQLAADIKAGEYAFQGYKDLKAYAKAFRGAGHMYQDYREFALAYSEAAMEGKMLENKMNDDLINEFYAKNGYMPTGKDADAIYQTSVNAGTANKMLNAGLIYFSNKMLFGKMFSGIPTGGELLTKVMSTSLGDLKKLPLKMGENFYKFAENGFLKRAAKSVISSPYSPLSRSYWMANFIEGLQEVAQDASAQGFEDYYKNIYAHPMQAGYTEMAEALARGTGKQLNGRGLETFASGFLTGALIGPGQYLASEVLPTQSRRLVPQSLRDKWGITSYQDLVNLRNQSKADTLNSLNEVLRDPNKMDMSAKDYFIQVLNHAKKVDEALRSGDPIRIKEAQSEMYSDHLHRVFRTGNSQLLKEYFSKALKMNDQELSEAFNQPIEGAKDIRDRMKSLNERVDKFEKIYNAIEERFPNLIDETQYKKGTPEYLAATRRSRSFEQAKKMAMFAMDYFQEATKSQKDAMQYLTTNKPFENMSSTDVSVLFDTKGMQDNIDLLNDEIRVLKQGDAKQKQAAAEKQTLANDLNNFKNSVAYFEKVSEMFRKSEGKEEARQELKDFAKISTGSVIQNAKGKKFKVVSTSGDILTLEDEKGKRYTRKNRKGLKLIAEGEEAGMLLDKEDPVEFAANEMFKSFKTYLKNRAKVSDTILMDDSIEKAFSKIKEFYHYKNSAKSMAGVVNALHDAKGMMALALRIETANKALEGKFNEYAEEAFKGHESAKDFKALLNKLYDKSVRLVLPEGMTSLMNKEVPKQFFDEATGMVFDEQSNPRKYKEMADIVNKFFEFRNAQEESDKAEKAKKEEEARKTEEELKKKQAEQQGIKLQPVSTELPEEKKILKKKVEYDTPFEQMPDKLQAAILEGARIAGISEGVIEEDSSQDELTASEWFRNQYLKYKHVQNQIDKYNKAEGYEGPAKTTTAAKVTPTTPTTTTEKGLVPEEVAARIDLVSKYGMEQSVVDKMTTPQVLAEYAKFTKGKQPVTKGAASPMQQYIADKESKPTSGLKPQIIYSTSTTGKTTLANKYSDIQDADFLLYQYMVGKGIVKEDTDPITFESSIQRAGKDFYNYITALKSRSGEDAANKVISEAITILQDSVKDGNVVLTSNYWMLNQDMQRFVSKDVEKIAEKLMARDPMITKDAAEEAAKNMVERESKSFKGRRATEIPSGKTIEEMLFPSEKAGFQEKTMKKIENADIDTIKEIEDSLNNLTREELLEANLKELNQAINERKLILLRKFDFDSIQEGDMFLDPQGNLIEIVLKGSTMLGGQYVEDIDAKAVNITRENMDKVLAYKYIEGLEVEVPEDKASTDAKTAAKDTIENSKSISKEDDAKISSDAKNAKKGSGLDMLKNNKDDLNDNC